MKCRPEEYKDLKEKGVATLTKVLGDSIPGGSRSGNVFIQMSVPHYDERTGEKTGDRRFNFSLEDLTGKRDGFLARAAAVDEMIQDAAKIDDPAVPEEEEEEEEDGEE